MSELSALAGSEGYGACDDEERFRRSGGKVTKAPFRDSVPKKPCALRRRHADGAAPCSRPSAFSGVLSDYSSGALQYSNYSSGALQYLGKRFMLPRWFLHTRRRRFREESPE